MPRTAPPPTGSTPPPLTDRATLTRQRQRALRAGNGAAIELHQSVADQVLSRLLEVNRTFTAPAVVTGFPQFWGPALADARSGALPDALSGALPDALSGVLCGVLSGARIVGDEPVLDLAPGTHDLVIHALCLHWADDPLGQIIQCARALKPDGLFLAVMPGGRSLQELRAALAQAEADLTGGLSPRVLPMTDIRDAGALLQRAGLALPVADVQPVPLAYRDLKRLAADLRGAGEGNALAARSGRPISRAFWAAARSVYAGAYADTSGLFPVTLELIWLTGWAPDASQPRPLRPGSASTRLAEALGTAERPLSPPPDV